MIIIIRIKNNISALLSSYIEELHLNIYKSSEVHGPWLHYLC